MNTLEDLNQAIAKLVEKETFSVSALKGIDELRIKAASLARENQTLVEQATKREATIAELRKQAETFTAEIQKWQAREAELQTRESMCRRDEISNAGYAAQSQTFRECFGMVFGNTRFREELVTQAANSNAWRVDGLGNRVRVWSEPEFIDTRSSKQTTQDTAAGQPAPGPVAR